MSLNSLQMSLMENDLDLDLKFMCYFLFVDDIPVGKKGVILNILIFVFIKSTVLNSFFSCESPVRLNSI